MRLNQTFHMFKSQPYLKMDGKNLGVPCPKPWAPKQPIFC